jgi:hypothetical protein
VVDVATIVTSASVAAGVTLGIEYAAKPWLEARKQRILTRHQLRTDVLDTLRLAHSNIGMIEDFITGSDGPDAADSAGARAVFRADLPRLRNEVIEQAFRLVQQARLVAAADDPVLYRVLTSTAGLLRAAGAEEVPRTVFEQVNEHVAYSQVMLGRRRWGSKSRKTEAEALRWIKGRHPISSG